MSPVAPAYGGAHSTARSGMEAWLRSLPGPVVLAALCLLVAGFVVSLAASPAAAARLGLSDPFYFVQRHAAFAGMALVVMLAIATLSPLGARRLGVIVCVLSVPLLVATLVAGFEVNGAQRWLRIAGQSVQVSEFAKPAFVVTAAWLITASGRAGAILAAASLYAVVAVLLLLQPDFGQTALLTAAFAAVLFLGGVGWRWLAAMAIAGGTLIALAALALPHVGARLAGFFSDDPDARYQLERAQSAIRDGGLFGQGLGEGRIKHQVPDAHTDFVLAVGAEEFGLVFVVALCLAFGIFVVGILGRARLVENPSARAAGAGLAVLIGLQALINIAVNLGLAPPKGMTLPFVSYGGSSLLATGFAAGLALAFTRRPIDAPGLREKRGPL